MTKPRIHSKQLTLFQVLLVCSMVLPLPALLCAATLRVPQNFPNVKAAYNAAATGDTILLQPNLYLEVPPALFGNTDKLVLFRMAGGSAIITANIPPANDTFANRTVLSGTTFSITRDNYTAALAPEPGDPLPRGTSAESFGRSLWFEWTAPTSGLVIVNTVGSDFNAVVDVFKGMAYPPARLDGELVWNGTINEVGFNAQPGGTYQILVGGYAAAHGLITLNVTTIDATMTPTNDKFTNAYPLIGNLVEVEGTSISATAEPLEPNHAGAAAGRSVWFSWTAPLGDGIPPRPVRITTGGSDFNTVLAVYEGSAVGQLLLVTNNDDGPLFTGESEVTFTPTPGTTYHIALDGSTNSQFARGQFGSYLLRLDYSVVDVGVRQVSEMTTSDDRVSFQADLKVRDWGFVPTAPLRIRLTARPGRSLVDIHREPDVEETDLSVSPVSAPNGLLAGQSESLTVSAVTPPALPPPFPPGPTFWGVFAVLEESFAGTWIPIDRAFILHAEGPFVASSYTNLSYGTGGSVPPALAPNEANQILGTGVRLSNFISDGSSNLFTMIAQFEDGREAVVSSATWTAPAWVGLASNGVLQMGAVPRTTNFTVTGHYNLGGVSRTVTEPIPIYKRPRLTFMPTTTRSNFQYVIQSDFSASYALEYKDDLLTTAWSTNSVGMFNGFPSTNALVGTSLKQRFYRVKLQP